MKKSDFINLLSGFGVGMVLCPAAVGGAPEQAAVPVNVEFDSIAMEGDVSISSDGMHESPLKLKFSINLSVNDPWKFMEYSDSAKQYLNLTDSSGARLAPVEFNLAWLHQSIRKGGVSASITGTAGEFPVSGVSWLRLHGTLKVPLARQRWSPVYELPLQEGAKIYFPLPGGDRDGPDGDIIVAPESPAASLSLQEYDRIEKEGKKMLRVKIILETESPFELETLEIVNDQDEVLKAEYHEGSSSIEGQERMWEKKMLVEDTGGARKLRLRLLYQVPAPLSAVPVDLIVGMRGEIDKGKQAGRPAEEKRAGKVP